MEKFEFNEIINEKCITSRYRHFPLILLRKIYEKKKKKLSKGVACTQYYIVPLIYYYFPEVEKNVNKNLFSV